MTEHNLFYYPYASFNNAQLPLLKVAALYFDKLVILDPVGASWDTIGADFRVRDTVILLKDAGILEVVSPATVLAKYEVQLTEAIRRDVGNDEFLAVCDAHARESGKQRWTLSLAKVPKDVQTDQIMRHLIGDLAQDVLRRHTWAMGRADEYEQYDETEVGAIIDQTRCLHPQIPEFPVYDEYREGYDGNGVEYRYADFPLALGEAIMLNHALFTGLLHAGATPLTDESFHSKLLDLKLRHAQDIPAVRQALEDRTRRSQIKADDLVFAALQDHRLNLPVLNPELSLENILEYRRKHADALAEARETLGIMAQGIKTEPWTEAFRDELENGPLKDLRQKLVDVRKARDSWLRSKRGKLALSAAGIGVAAATVTLTLMIAPITPIALATAGLSLATGFAIPGAEWLIDWRDGKKTMQENGLHYLLRT